MSIDSDPQLYSSGYERNRLDRYWTDPWMTQELFRTLNTQLGIGIPGPVWEPAAGRGDMSQAIRDYGNVSVYSSDIDMSKFDPLIGPGHENSFLHEFEIPLAFEMPCQSIITNPPYSQPYRGIAIDFIKQGLGFFDDGINFMAMLFRSEFCSGKTRNNIFGECRHDMGELVLTTRPRWDYGNPDAPKKASPRHNFSWFLWWKTRHERNTPFQLFSYLNKAKRA